VDLVIFRHHYPQLHRN